MISRLILFFSLLFFQSCIKEKIATKQPIADKGVLNLRYSEEFPQLWDFEKNGAIYLSGEWEFYSNNFLLPSDFENGKKPSGLKYIKVPSFWTGSIFEEEFKGIGYGTYRLVILTSKDYHSRAIRFLSIATASRMWVGGEGVFASGKVGRDEKEHEPSFKNAYFHFPANYDEIEILIQVSNFSQMKGGILSEILFGNEDQVSEIRDNSIFIDLFLFGLLSAISLYHIVIYLVRRKDSSPLYYGLFCFIVSLYLSTQRERILYEYFSVSWLWNLKLESISFYLMVGIFMKFLESLFPKYTNKIFINFILFISLAFCTVVVITDGMIFPYLVEPFLYITVFFGIYIIYVVVRNIIDKIEGAIPFLISFLILYLFFILELSNITEGYKEFFSLQTATILFFLFQVVSLAKRFSKGFLTSEILSETLAEKNKRLVELDKIKDDLIQATTRFFPNDYLKFFSKDSILGIELGDHISKEMTVMFSDIRSFTTVSETMSPAENFSFVNSYLARVSPVIHDNNGIIVKYLGDGMMAMFPNSVEDSLRSANEKILCVKEYNIHRIKKNRIPIQVGIGMNFGKMMFGLVGEERRLQGDAFSDNVNLAARLEGLTKFYSVEIILSSSVYQMIDDHSKYSIRFLDRVKVKGKSIPVAIYEQVTNSNERLFEQKLKTLNLYEQAIHHYFNQELKFAKEKFLQVLTICPTDNVSSLYMSRIEFFLKNGIPASWDGSFQMETK
ncbi:MAG: adenylate/guanylate cyclase domain-containing protein [Leptospiraceae bacterium]|nr:adenylate/guanylate cyclase domain-containing protein [Leptospiraceae bacterium]